MSKVSRVVANVVVWLAVVMCGMVQAEQYSVTESFDGCSIGASQGIGPYDILDDLIGDARVAGDYSRNYETRSTGNSLAEMTVKTYKLKIAPSIVVTDPLKKKKNVLYTGKSTITTSGISKWYHAAMLRYDLTVPCTSLGLTFSYLNNRGTQGGGKATLVIQNVDENENVMWEVVWDITGYQAWNKNWRTVTANATTMTSKIAGREFNRIYFGETDLRQDVSGGGYFDDVTFTVTPIEVEKEISPPEAEEMEIWDAVNAVCPCENNWRNHGQYVKCVVQAVHDLDGVFRGDGLDHVISEAARTDCGK